MMKTQFVRRSAPSLSLPGAWQDFDNLFTQVFQRMGRDTPSVNQTRDGESDARLPLWRAPASLWEEDGRYLFEMEIPGVAPEDVGVTVNAGVLSVTADKKSPEEERDYKHHERSFGKLECSVVLPKDVDADSIEATVTHGVLRVTLLKQPEVQPRRIEVQTG